MIKKLLLNSDACLSKGKAQLSSSLHYLWLLLTLFLMSGATYAQGSLTNDYTFAQSTGPAYTDMVGGTSVSGAAGVSFGATAINATGISVGFNFVFNNASYSTVTISDNGYITFGAVSPAGTTTPISSTTGYNGAISGFGYNLAGNIAVGASTAYSNDGADIKYQTTGSAGSQVFTVEYKNMKRRNLTTNIDGLLSFQIRLYEADMRIEILYKVWAPPVATSTSGQVGLRGLTNADYSNRIGGAGGTWTPSTNAGGANNANIALTNTLGPAASTMFTWTPTCFNPTNAVVSNLQFDNPTFTANFSWTPAQFLTTSFSNYIYEVRLTNAPFTTILGPLTTTGTTASVSGLAAGTSYTLYVRSSCKPFAQSITTTVSPSCSTGVFPYSENFESVVVPAIPPCTSTVVTTGAAMVTVNNVTPYYGFSNKNLKTASVAATDTWFFTRLISLTAGNTYRVSYKYGGSRELAQFNQRMQVKIGTVNTAAGMTTLLANHDAIKSSPNTFTFHFVAPGTGNYYLGFNGYAAFNNGYLQIDEISLGDPTCASPTSLTPASVTYNSAIVGWTAPSPAPSAGYEYYLSTSSTAPIATSSISGVIGGTVTTLTGLASSTTYYIWVRSNCAGVYSAWSTPASFTTLAPPPSPCVPAPTSVDSQGIINVTIGSINNTTGAETGNYGNYTSLSTNISQNTTVNMSIRFSIAGFLGSGYYTRIWIDYNDDGDFFDAGETVFDNGGAELPNGLNNISFNVPLTAALGPHRMRIGASDSNNLSQVVAPATSNGPCYTGAWGTFEDYSVFVTSPPPPLTISGSSTSYCNGGSSPLITLTAGAGSYDNFVWNPAGGVTGDAVSGWTFSPTNPGVNTYTLTATQASGLFLSNTVTYTVTVYDVPTPIVFTPATIPVCAGITTPIVATGGIVNGVVVIEEDFNSPTNSFVAFNTSTGGIRLGPAGATWTLRPSPYLEPFNSATFSSNDSSQFFMTNSDAQGSGGNTNTEIVSPDLDLSTYTNVSMSFWHHYRDLGGTAEVQIMIDTNGTLDLNASEVWTTLRVYNSDQGGRTSFVNEIIDLSAYAIPANTHVRIKFKYIDAPYAWWWCIDNFKITGSAPALLTWAPTTGLWLDAGATVPYTGSATGIVYAKLNADQTYVATAAALTPPFCDTNASVTVTVTQPGTATGNQTLSCGDTAISSNISLTGYVPNVPATIVGWQIADNPSFTGATTIPGSAGKNILTAADVTGLSSTSYIRAMIQGCPTLFSNTITITYPTVTWNGAWNPGPPVATDNVTVTSGTLTLSADLSVCSLKVNNGATVNVNPGVTLTVNGIVNVATTGALNFLDDTTYPFSGAASLMQNPLTTTNANISSATNVTYQRTIYTRKFDYTYWSSPVANNTLFNLAPGTLPDKYIKFDSNSYQWTYPNAALTTMAPGVGYGIRGPQAYSATSYLESTHIFRGTPNNGDYSVTTYNNSPGNDLNFLGNPYPSPLSADLLMDGNAGALGAFGTGTTFYFWTHNTLFNGSNYVSSDFATYNRTGGTLGAIPTAGAPGLNNAVPTGIISSGQGFMARVVTPGTSTVTFKNSMRVAGNNAQFYRVSATQEKHRLWLDLTDASGEMFKQLLVGYVENATNAYEDGFDGAVLEAGNPISFYSVVGSKNLTIQGRALPFDSSDQVPLGYKAEIAGSYTITLSNTDGLLADSSYPVYIEDTLLNTYHDLKSGPYTFVTEAGTFNNRFVLRYTNLLNVSPVDFQENDVVVFKQLDDIRIETSNVNMQSVKVYDVQGRLIISKSNLNTKSVLLPNLGLASQVLMVQVTSADGVVVNKKIIF